jgi:hypothetical protein
VQPLAGQQLRVFPNPSEGLFRFERDAALEEAYTLEVRDMQGRLVQGWSSMAAQLDIDLTAVEAGLYLLKYQSAAGSQWMRLVKQ